MPKGGGSYGSGGVGDETATTLKRKPAMKTMYDQTNPRPSTEEARGKFGGLPGGPSGGRMNTGGKRRPGRMGK